MPLWTVNERWERRHLTRLMLTRERRIMPSSRFARGFDVVVNPPRRAHATWPRDGPRRREDSGGRKECCSRLGINQALPYSCPATELKRNSANVPVWRGIHLDHNGANSKSGLEGYIDAHSFRQAFWRKAINLRVASSFEREVTLNTSVAVL